MQDVSINFSGVDVIIIMYYPSDAHVQSFNSQEGSYSQILFNNELVGV